jgi:hypothetical protein
MQDNQKTVVVGDPAALGSVATRRSFLRALGVGGTVVLLPSVFAACSESSASLAEPRVQDAYRLSQTVSLNLSTDVGILNYAFALEQLEAGFYTAVLAAPAFAALSTDERELLTDLRNHEVIHREFLRAAIPANGGTLIPDLAADFSSAVGSRDTILATARSFEDLGVAAYNGAGKYLVNTAFLLLAGKIVSVEARHAAAIRDVLDTAGTAFATFTAAEETSLGANNATALDGAREPSAVLSAVGATNLLRTPVAIGTGPTAL